MHVLFVWRLETRNFVLVLMGFWDDDTKYKSCLKVNYSVRDLNPGTRSLVVQCCFQTASSLQPPLT